MITFHFAVEAFTSARNFWYWAEPSIVLSGLLIRSRQACGGGAESAGANEEKVFRVDCGAVGAKSGAPPLSQAPLSSASALRNERSSRKKTWRFLPQRNVR